MEVRNGYRILYYKLFQERLTQLEKDVAELKQKLSEDEFKRHPTAKLLAYVYKSIRETVPANPHDKVFLLGNTLGETSRHWRRVKHGLPPRYRLFFRFLDEPLKFIMYVWLNDEKTLRKEGDKRDVYAVFQRMISRGIVPTSTEDLMAEAKRMLDAEDKEEEQKKQTARYGQEPEPPKEGDDS